MAFFKPLLLLGLGVTAVLGKPVEVKVQGLGQPKVPVTSDVWNNLVYYAPFAFASATGPSCANPPNDTTLEQFFNVTSTDTQAALWKSEARKEFVLTFPGTEGNRDLITDLVFVPIPYISRGAICAGCLVHTGFLAAWNSAYSVIVASLTQTLAANPDYTLTITGHSLGAALASLAFGSLKSNPAFRIKEMYTYGGPRVGNLLFANYLDRLAGADGNNAGIHYRVTHANDAIPLIPPNLVGLFVHPRTEYWESDNANPSEGTTYRCFGQEPLDCINSQFPSGAEPNPHVTYAGMQYSCSA